MSVELDEAEKAPQYPELMKYVPPTKIGMWRVLLVVVLTPTLFLELYLLAWFFLTWPVLLFGATIWLYQRTLRRSLGAVERAVAIVRVSDNPQWGLLEARGGKQTWFPLTPENQQAMPVGTVGIVYTRLSHFVDFKPLR